METPIELRFTTKEDKQSGGATLQFRMELSKPQHEDYKWLRINWDHLMEHLTAAESREEYKQFREGFEVNKIDGDNDDETKLSIYVNFKPDDEDNPGYTCHTAYKRLLHVISRLGYNIITEREILFESLEAVNKAYAKHYGNNWTSNEGKAVIFDYQQAELRDLDVLMEEIQPADLRKETFEEPKDKHGKNEKQQNKKQPIVNTDSITPTFQKGVANILSKITAWADKEQKIETKSALQSAYSELINITNTPNQSAEDIKNSLVKKIDDIVNGKVDECKALTKEPFWKTCFKAIAGIICSLFGILLASRKVRTFFFTPGYCHQMYNVKDDVRESNTNPPKIKV